MRDGCGTGYAAKVTENHQVVPAGVAWKQKNNKCCGLKSEFTLEAWFKKELEEIIADTVKKVLREEIKGIMLKK